VGFYLRLFGACVSAEAATFLTAAGVFGLRSNFAAVDAIFAEVRSFLAILRPLLIRVPVL
jgi:hypothetical protein